MDTALACAPFGFRQQHLHEYDYSESYETFHIDDLLDFDNDDIGAPIGNCEEDNENTTSVDSTEASVSVSASASVSLDRNNSPENPLADEALGSELYVPTDALADLEWLSPYMVDDDFSSLPAVVPSYDGKISKDGDETKASQQKNLQGCEERTKDFSTCSMGQWRFPVRARRSKRSRTGGRVWTTYPVLILPNCSAFESLFTFTSSDSSSSATSATSRPPLKKMKINHSKKSSQEAAAAAAPPRRCSHCLVQKTPQWRAGPDGPKTLCNACGVRYKSGRLLPEYRPAVSPTFLSDFHSNSHRKVLELRRHKEEHHKFEPQICEKMASQEDEEDRREYSTVTEETFIEY